MKQFLKIGIVCYPTVGGSGIIATELGKLLADRGHEIHFITSSTPFRLTERHHNIYYHQVEVNHYPVFQYPPYDIALASKMAEVVDRESLDLLHVHYAIPHAVCGILAKQMATRPFKLVTTLHGTDISVLGYEASLTDAIRFGIEHSDSVTAVSDSLVEQTKELLKPNKHIHTVHNFVDEKIYKRMNTFALKQEYHIEPDEKVIIHVSNFRPVKRIEDVIRVFANVQAKLPAKLLLVGDGPEMKKVYELIDELNIADRVLLLGKQKSVNELYSISDLMLLLSDKESFGLVALEAMACEVPCIGTNAGGIPEVITDNEDGYICEVGDVEEISKKAITLLSQDHLHHQFSSHAQKTVFEKFYSKKIVAQYEDIYYQTLLEETIEGVK